MTGPASQDAQATVQAVVENAQRLGLTWALRPATVVSSSPITAVFDGDTEPINMTSMVGSVSIGQRVYVFVVPPSGNYIAGFVTTDPSHIPSFWQDRQRIGAAQPSILFTDIPINLRSVRIKWRARVTGAVALADITVQINSDGSAAYNDQLLQVNAAVVTPVAISPFTAFRLGVLAGATAPAGMYGSGTADIIGWDPPYTGFLGCTAMSQSMSSGLAIEMNGAAYNTAGPYTSMMFVPGSGSFDAGTDIQIEGTYA